MKKILILVIVLVAVGGGIYFYNVSNNAYINPEVLEKKEVSNLENNEASNLFKPPLNYTEKNFTMDEISKHNSRVSCYTVVRGNVYDLTNFKDSHPGGEKAILSICGKDGSSAFEDQHGGQNKPENQLVKLKIGVLSK